MVHRETDVVTRTVSRATRPAAAARRTVERVTGRDLLGPLVDAAAAKVDAAGHHGEVPDGNTTHEPAVSGPTPAGPPSETEAPAADSEELLVLQDGGGGLPEDPAHRATAQAVAYLEARRRRLRRELQQRR